MHYSRILINNGLVSDRVVLYLCACMRAYIHVCALCTRVCVCVYIRIGVVCALGMVWELAYVEWA